MTLSSRVARGPAGAIGSNNALIWHVSEDLRYFKKTTMGHPVLMGRNTFASIGKALPNRPNFVISRNPATVPGDHTGVEFFTSPAEALTQLSKRFSGEIFVLGGGMLYKELLPFADRLYLTKINAPLPDGIQPDAFFPEIDYSQWQEIYREDYPAGATFPHPFSFIQYLKKD